MTEDKHWTFSLVPESSLPIWILRIERPSGRIVLNPDIPQEEAVVKFVQLCNDLVGRQNDR
jgi:hypothetical protein